jgi:hypothetical protein
MLRAFKWPEPLRNAGPWKIYGPALLLLALALAISASAISSGLVAALLLVAALGWILLALRSRGQPPSLPLSGGVRPVERGLAKVIPFPVRRLDAEP